MSMLLGEIDWIEVMIRVPVLLFSFSLHEFSHSFTAYALGDVTQKKEGRLTLSPFKHIDWIGFLCLLLFHIGWAKPVSVDPRYFAKKETGNKNTEIEEETTEGKAVLKKGMKGGMVLSSLAGPSSNFVLAFLSMMVYYPLYRIYFGDGLAIYSSFSDILNGAGGTVPVLVRFIMLLLYESIQLNIVLGVFNMIPIPPLDGSKVFSAFLPAGKYFRFINGGGVTSFIFLILIITGALSSIISPVAGFIYGAYYVAAYVLFFFL